MSNTTPLTPETEMSNLKNNNKKLADGFEDYYYYDDEDDNNADTDISDKVKPLHLEDVEVEEEEQETNQQNDGKQNEMKRSAEDMSNMNTATLSTTMASTPTTNVNGGNNSSSHSNGVRNHNNYTNFTEPFHASDGSNNTMSQTEDFNNPSSDSRLKANIMMASASILATSVNSLSALIANNVTQLPPGTPKITRPSSPPGDWLRSMDAAVAAVSPPPLSVTATGTTTEVTDDKFPFTLENVHKSEDLRRDENEPRRRQSKGLSADYKPPGYINYSPESKNLLTRSASTTVNDYDSEESNISSEALSVQRAYFMDVGAISAICFTVFGICCTVGTIGMVLYRRRFLNKPQALSEPDSSVYIDDSTMRVSDNSDEMYSLDNDSFLNSLEAMTIQNYWTDTVKHTKL
ncbi:uncharacterized protein LOC133333603 [Musca vetustissima]|uniref:uncharacterized protein LOC133333603 n=1 Tax=Musca vetustissima TaxID=27455 RepID=UPI002AB6B7F0|nr:uncharacterized protein LOC133333603 [Musca vetustissima]